MIDIEELSWLVVYKAKASRFEPEFEGVVAAFKCPSTAQDFIDKCLPEETRNRFYIRHAD